MNAIRITCFESKCRGVVYSTNDGAARLAARLGREVYACDACGARWSVDPAWYARQLQRDARGAVRTSPGRGPKKFRKFRLSC